MSVMADALKKVNEPEKEHIERALKALAPTLKAGELDVAAALFGPDAKGRHTVLAALGVKDGKEIEKLAKDFAVVRRRARRRSPSTSRRSATSACTRSMLSHVPEEVEKIFGTKTVWLAISDDAHRVQRRAGWRLRSEKGLKAKAAPVPVLRSRSSLAEAPSARRERPEAGRTRRRCSRTRSATAGPAGRTR